MPDDIRDLESGEAKKQSPKTNPLRAVQWPPRSPLQIFRNGVKYLKSIFKPLEVVFLGAFVVLCYKLPDLIIDQHYREVPYQTTKAGDIIYDSRFVLTTKEETFPGPIADAVTVYVPLSVFWLVGNFLGAKGDGHAAISMYTLAVALKIFMVEAIKNYVGYWRPNAYGTGCQSEDCLPKDPADLGWFAYSSFPSGHAATAMMAGTLLSFYLLGKIAGWAQQRRTTRYWSPSFPIKLLLVAACIPFLVGVFIAVSRIVDDWHHPADVLAGIEIGIVTALLAHALYYPSTLGEWAGIPRSALADLGGPRHDDNEHYELSERTQPTGKSEIEQSVSNSRPGVGSRTTHNEGVSGFDNEASEGSLSMV